jgi:hypothetical protein
VAAGNWARSREPTSSPFWGERDVMMRVERPKERSLDDWGLACLMCFNVLGKLKECDLSGCYWSRKFRGGKVCEPDYTY